MILTREQLIQKVWGATDLLREVLDSSDVKKDILALFFLKRLSDVFEERHEEIVNKWMAEGRMREEAIEIANNPNEYKSAFQ